MNVLRFRDSQISHPSLPSNSFTMYRHHWFRITLCARQCVPSETYAKAAVITLSRIDEVILCGFADVGFITFTYIRKIKESLRRLNVLNSLLSPPSWLSTPILLILY